MFLIWIQFFVGAIIIFFAGRRLARSGEILVEKTGLGYIWVGTFFLAIATSLPELFTSAFGATALEKAPDLALGNIFGSILFNIFIIALLDLIFRRKSILRGASLRAILSSVLSIILLLLIAQGLILRLTIGFFKVGIDTILIAFCYIFGLRLIFNYEKKKGLLASKIESRTFCFKEISRFQTYRNFLILTLLIFGVSLWVAHTADEIAILTNLGRTFVGTIFLAVVTSLPELSVCATLIRRNLADMAVGTIFGSNAFNCLIIFICDLFFRGNTILSSVSNVQLWTVTLCLAVSIIPLLGLALRPSKVLFRLSWESIAISFLYIAGMWTIFR